MEEEGKQQMGEEDVNRTLNIYTTFVLFALEIT